MRRTSGALAGLIGLTIAATAVSLPATALAKRASLCERTTKRIERSKRLVVRRVTRYLERLHRKDPRCLEAPRLALQLLHKDWDRVVPEATRRVSVARVRKELNDHKDLVALTAAIARFRTSPIRPQAILAMGRLHEAMARYLEETGEAGNEVILIRDPNALYHSRAVDLREYLKLQAEEAYAAVIRALEEKASRQNETLVAARTHLATLKKRYVERVPPPPPPAPEDEGVGPPPLPDR